MRLMFVVPAACALAWAGSAAAQESEPQSVDAFEGDHLAIGLGAAYVPSYDGSDDYTVTAFPLVQGSLGGIRLSPRAAGVAIDVIPDDDEGPHFSFGPTVRLRANRTHDVKDPVVELLPELDTALEIGPTVGVSFPAVLNPYDSLSFGLDARWDVLGAHDGMVIAPTASYTTPFSAGVAAMLSFGAEWADESFMDYYYSIDAAGATASGLPQFDAEAGFRSVNTQLMVGFDLSGDLRDGGLALFAVGGYGRLLGDAADTPITELRGSADQFTAGAGVAYTF